MCSFKIRAERVRTNQKWQIRQRVIDLQSKSISRQDCGCYIMIKVNASDFDVCSTVLSIFIVDSIATNIENISFYSMFLLSPKRFSGKTWNIMHQATWKGEDAVSRHSCYITQKHNFVWNNSNGIDRGFSTCGPSNNFKGPGPNIVDTSPIFSGEFWRDGPTKVASVSRFGKWFDIQRFANFMSAHFVVTCPDP